MCLCTRFVLFVFCCFAKEGLILFNTETHIYEHACMHYGACMYAMLCACMCATSMHVCEEAVKRLRRCAEAILQDAEPMWVKINFVFRSWFQNAFDSLVADLRNRLGLEAYCP